MTAKLSLHLSIAVLVSNFLDPNDFVLVVNSRVNKCCGGKARSGQDKGGYVREPPGSGSGLNGQGEVHALRRRELY